MKYRKLWRQLGSRTQDAEPLPPEQGESLNGGQQENRREMGTLSDLQEQDETQSISGHRLGQVPVILPEVQARNKDRYGSVKDGFEQRARRIDAEPAPLNQGAGSFCSMVSLFMYRFPNHFHLHCAAHSKLPSQLN